MHPFAKCGFVGALLASCALAVAGTAIAQDPKLPPSLTFTAYDTGTAGFNIAVGVGKMIKDKYGSDVRVLPAGNDVARLVPLKTGRAVAAAMGSGVFFAQEGVFEFATRDWGPQALQVTLSAVDCNAGSLGVARDTGVKRLEDLKGLRVGFVVGSPALNQNSLAVLAFAGLTRKDVKIVEFSSYGAMWKGIVNNEIDAAFATTITAPAREAETSPRGLVWPPLPHDNAAGWERMQKIGPFFYKHTATCGAGISKDKPVELGNYPYPIFTVYGTQAEEQVYALTKAMIAGYDSYKDFGARRGRPEREGADQELGTAGSRWGGASAEGGWRLERRAGGAQQRPIQAPGAVCEHLGRLPEVQSACRRGEVPRRLDGRAQGSTRQGGHVRQLRVSAPCRLRGSAPAQTGPCASTGPSA